jgi:membrane protein DedA with SNARE-associated domain
MVTWLDELVRQAGLLGLAVLFLGAAIEYLFPPFPGDTVTVAGGIYAIRGNLPILSVFAAVMAGSIAGATADWAIGRWIGKRIGSAPSGKRILRLFTREQLLEWEARFRKRGTFWLLANRFFPGIRGPIFLAAGVSSISLARVVLLGGASSLVWNGLLFAAGVAVGGEMDRLTALARGVGVGAWIVLGVAAAALGARALWRRRVLKLSKDRLKPDRPRRDT